MSLGLAESLQAQLALEIVIQVGPELCPPCPGQGRAGRAGQNNQSDRSGAAVSGGKCG